MASSREESLPASALHSDPNLTSDDDMEYEVSNDNVIAPAMLLGSALTHTYNRNS